MKESLKPNFEAIQAVDCLYDAQKGWLYLNGSDYSILIQPRKVKFLPPAAEWLHLTEILICRLVKFML
jgi:hypothetical protein